MRSTRGNGGYGGNGFTGGTEQRRQSNGRSVGFTPVWIDHTLDAVYQALDVEVDRQADGQVGEFQIRQQLRLMHRQHLGHCLHFHDDGRFHQQIESVIAVQWRAFVDERQTLLADERQVARAKFVLKTSRIGRFEESGAENPMDFDGCADDVVGEGSERNLPEHAEKVSKSDAVQLFGLLSESVSKSGSRCVLAAGASTKNLKSPFASASPFLL